MKKLISVIPLILICNLAVSQIQNIIYVDKSEANSTNQLYDQVMQLCDSLAYDGQFLIFISNDNQPIFIDSGEDYQTELRRLYSIDPGAPIPSVDIEAIMDYIKDKQLDNNVHVHFFSNLYVLMPKGRGQISSNVEKLFVILGSDLSDPKTFASNTIFISNTDANANPELSMLLENLYPYKIKYY